MSDERWIQTGPDTFVEDNEFGGETYQPVRDKDRLRAQLARVKRVMSDGEWRTLGTIAFQTGDPEASVSARLRDLRKAKFGGYTVERDYLGDGLWRYRVLIQGTLS